MQTKTEDIMISNFSKKAVHVELVNNYTTESFLSSIKRFMCSRGKVAYVSSDNATYF